MVGDTWGHQGDTYLPFTPSSPAGSALAELEQDWQEGSGGGGGSLHPFSLFPPKLQVGSPPPISPLTSHFPPDSPGQFSAAFQDGSYLALPGHLFPRG